MRGTRGLGRFTTCALTVLVLLGDGLSGTGQPTTAAFPGKNGKIAFAGDLVTAGNPEGDFEISTMNPAGSGVTQLTKNAATDEDPTWSPDGKKIGFTSTRDGNVDVSTMGAAGANPTRRTMDAAFDGYPAWSPNGERLAFQSDRDGKDEVYLMWADGRRQVNGTSNGASDFDPDWQPRRRR